MSAAARRYEILIQIGELKALGLTTREACARVGVKVQKYRRWLAKFDPKVGMLSLRTDHHKCGRRPDYVMTPSEVKAVRTIYLQTRSWTTSFRLFADSAECSQELANIVFKKRKSKHSLPKSLLDQVKMPEAILTAYNSPKDFSINCLPGPRKLTYRDALGNEQPLLVGDLSERDDMSNNFIGWVEWPWGGDKCSDRFGVRIARGQALMQIDVASLFPQSFNFVVRLRDSYRADDIWQWIGHGYRNSFVPVIGERWERGIWESNLVRGKIIEPGHTSQAEREGGLNALGRRVITAYSPGAKIIENRFNFIQTVEGVIVRQIGRKPSQMQETQKLWNECREGRRDPRNHFLHMTKLCAQMEEALRHVSYEPVEGAVHYGIPAEIYQKGLEERAEQLRPLAAEKCYLFSRDRRESTVRKSVISVRYRQPDGRLGLWTFGNKDTWRFEGEPMMVYLDETCPGAGATIVPMRPGVKDKSPMACELIEGVPQFNLGTEKHFEEEDSISRRKAIMSAVRSEIRILRPGHLPGIRISNVQDGTGASATVTDQPGKRFARKPVTEKAEPSPGGRRLPISQDAEYMRRLEDEFREANPDLAST